MNMMTFANYLFASVDLVVGVMVLVRALRFHNWGVAGLMVVYILLKAPYSLGQTTFAPSFFFWLFYDLAMLAAIWFEMGKRREVTP
jgi:hypothetical protein